MARPGKVADELPDQPRRESSEEQRAAVQQTFHGNTMGDGAGHVVGPDELPPPYNRSQLCQLGYRGGVAMKGLGRTIFSTTLLMSAVEVAQNKATKTAGQEALLAATDPLTRHQQRIRMSGELPPLWPP